MKKHKKSNLKNITYIIIWFMVVLLLFTGCSIGKSFNQYTIKSQAQIAEPIVEVIAAPKLDITNIKNEGTYKFYIRNYNNNEEISQTKIEYSIFIKDTIEDNLKDTIKYELYKNGKKVELKNKKTEKMELSNKQKQQEQYELKIRYDERASLYMQDIFEKVQIQLYSEQKSIN